MGGFSTRSGPLLWEELPPEVQEELRKILREKQEAKAELLQFGGIRLPQHYATNLSENGGDSTDDD